jgi:hypothetical protein
MLRNKTLFLIALAVSMVMACSGGGGSITAVESLTRLYDAIGAVTLISSCM